MALDFEGMNTGKKEPVEPATAPATTAVTPKPENKA